MAKEYKTVTTKMTEVAPHYIARYVEWYFSDKNKRKSWEEFNTCDTNIKGKTEEFCESWLTREDTINAIQVYMKHMKKYNLVQIYNSMLQKALSGDTNAAKWVENFSKTEFFDESDSELDNFLTGINIPALKGGGKSGNQ